MAIITYENLDRPYNGNMDRSGGIINDTQSEVGVPRNNSLDPAVNNPADALPGTILPANLNNLWISSFIKSKNYLPRKRGFWIDGRTGYIEAQSFRANLVSIIGNDIILADDSIGGTSPVSGNVSTIYFERSDGGAGVFIIQKRKTTISNLGNAVEFFFQESPSNGVRNYIFLGSTGTIASPSDTNTHVIRIHAKQMIQMGTDSFFNRTNATTEIQTYNIDAPGASGINAGGSVIVMGAIECDTPVSFASGGSAVYIGIQKNAGYDVSLVIDTSGLWIANHTLPATTDTYNLGGASNYFADIYTRRLRLEVLTSDPTGGARGDIWCFDNGATEQFRGIPTGTAVYSFDMTVV